MEYIRDSYITISFWLLKHAGRHAIFLLAMLSWTVAGCGEEDAVLQHYNPSSPLPLRVEVVATPIPFPTPDDAPDNTLTPTPTVTVIPEDIDMAADPTTGATPTQTPKPREVSPTATPTMKPAATPTPTSKIDKKRAKPLTAPMPLRVVEPPKKTDTVEPDNLPTPTEKDHESPTVNAEPEREDLATSADAKPESEDITTSEKPLEEISSESAEYPSSENDPIVTPYNVTIDQLRVCSRLRNRNPSGCADTFSLADTGKVFTWMRVSGVKPPQMIKHVYYWEKKKVATVSLKLKYSSMRTWSQKTFKPDQAGTWKVVITTGDDKVMATRTWTVTP